MTCNDIYCLCISRKTGANFIDYALFGDAHERLWQTPIIVSNAGKWEDMAAPRDVDVQNVLPREYHEDNRRSYLTLDL
jgi:hypothetical protein